MIEKSYTNIGLQKQTPIEEFNYSMVQNFNYIVRSPPVQYSLIKIKKGHTTFITTEQL